MRTELLFVVGAAVILAVAFNRVRDRIKPEWSQHLSGGQKVFGLLAFLAVLLIVMNPEFVALGLVGDTAFFDMLILALTLQMHTFAIRACRWAGTLLARGVKYAGIPSPGFRYVVVVSTVALTTALSTFQKAVYRIAS
jgi:hypothetical protein